MIHTANNTIFTVLRIDLWRFRFFVMWWKRAAGRRKAHAWLSWVAGQTDEGDDLFYLLAWHWDIDRRRVRWVVWARDDDLI